MTAGCKFEVLEHDSSRHSKLQMFTHMVVTPGHFCFPRKAKSSRRSRKDSKDKKDGKDKDKSGKKDKKDKKNKKDSKQRDDSDSDQGDELPQHFGMVSWGWPMSVSFNEC